MRTSRREAVHSGSSRRQHGERPRRQWKGRGTAIDDAVRDHNLAAIDGHLQSNRLFEPGERLDRRDRFHAAGTGTDFDGIIVGRVRLDSIFRSEPDSMSSPRLPLGLARLAHLGFKLTKQILTTGKPVADDPGSYISGND